MNTQNFPCYPRAACYEERRWHAQDYREDNTACTVYAGGSNAACAHGCQDQDVLDGKVGISNDSEIDPQPKRHEPINPGLHDDFFNHD